MVVKWLCEWYDLASSIICVVFTKLTAVCCATPVCWMRELSIVALLTCWPNDMTLLILLAWQCVVLTTSSQAVLCNIVCVLLIVLVVCVTVLLCVCMPMTVVVKVAAQCAKTIGSIPSLYSLYLFSVWLWLCVCEGSDCVPVLTVKAVVCDWWRYLLANVASMTQQALVCDSRYLVVVWQCGPVTSEQCVSLLLTLLFSSVTSIDISIIELLDYYYYWKWHYSDWWQCVCVLLTYWYCGSIEGGCIGNRWNCVCVYCVCYCVMTMGSVKKLCEEALCVSGQYVCVYWGSVAESWQPGLSKPVFSGNLVWPDSSIDIMCIID